MPQLSPMSWVLVFWILLFCVILFMVSVWWGVLGEYEVIKKDKVGGIISGMKGSAVGWGFGKKFWLMK